MSWLKKILPAGVNKGGTKKADVPSELWSKCPGCSEALYRSDLDSNADVCPKCGHHMYIGARKRLLQFFDEGTVIEFADDVLPVDFLKFKDTKKYKDRLVEAKKKSGENEALVVMGGTLLGLMDLVAVAFEYRFIGGSMGAAVGERFVQAVNQCIENKCPLVCFSASGGARMQESLMSLMQMSKTSAALAKLSQKGLPFISVLTDPTMGGVSASLAMLGDVIIAEPKALVGFAGPRVIEQTVRQTLPEGFQRSEFLLENGAIDMIVSRLQMREKIAALLSKLMGQKVSKSLP